MKWLFLMFVLDTSLGEVRPKLRINGVFESEEACNRVGGEVARDTRYEDASLKSFSTCIPESVFAQKGLQSERFE